MSAAVAEKTPQVKTDTFHVLRDFGTMIGTSFMSFKAGQRLSMASDPHIISALLSQGSPIQAEGAKNMETCPRCSHVFASNLER